MQSITSFRGEYDFLSNFYPCEIRVGTLHFATLEHAYQASKTLDLYERQRICYAATPGQAKSRGRHVTLRPDWNSIKLTVMHQLLRQKFAPGSALCARLLATGSAQLVEGNTWGDRYWGVYAGQGENWLGRLLMTIRSERSKESRG